MKYKPVRRSALIGPWGVGAIVPFPNDESLMIAGLDMWRYNGSDDFVIVDERLQKRLDIKELRWPPDFRDKSSDPVHCNLKIPAVRFPRWHYCPYCGTMQKVGYFTKPATCNASYKWPNGRNCTPSNHPRRLIPERFVVACPNGHIDDFPVAEWTHYDSGHVYNPDTCVLRRSTGGTSAALTGVRYTCSCGASKSMKGAMAPGALKKIGYKCRAVKPWLGLEEDEENPCTAKADEIKVIQRGATNAWFANVISSIHIPTEDANTAKKIIGVISETFDYVNNHRINGEIDRAAINMIAAMKQVNADELYDAFVKKINNLEGLPEVNETTTEDQYRIAEYKMLVKNSGSDALDFHCINNPISAYHEILNPLFKSVSLVKKLRETRAIYGFSRLEPSSENDIKKSKAMLRLGTGDWLPAIEVYGEGIFFEFDYEHLKEWAGNRMIVERTRLLNDAYNRSNFSKSAPGNLRPEYILLHTFAHLIINQLSYECGYGSSSIRERIYCERCTDESQMCGVLIYTASGDSEGSLGGLVRQGEPGRLEDTILAAIRNAEWCSADPICIESVGQGPESLNLSACHNCALLPETCCECGNRLLDRGVVVGTLNQPNIGYFSRLRSK